MPRRQPLDRLAPATSIVDARVEQQHVDAGGLERDGADQARRSAANYDHFGRHALVNANHY